MRLGFACALLFLAGGANAEEPLAFVDLGGAPVQIEAPASGKAVVLHFWTTWCPSCKQELPELDRVASACRGAGVEVIAVDVGEDAETVQQYLSDRPLAIRVLRDPTGSTWRESGGREMPANLIWTQPGRSWALGPSTPTQWRERLAHLGCDPLGPVTSGFLE